MKTGNGRWWATGGAWAGPVAAVVVGASAVTAQERPVGDPVAVHGETFAVVNTVRELADGRVLVADPLSKVLVLLDPSLQRADTLGRLGEGPREYLQPDAVWPLPGDSTLLVDLGNTRLTALGPDGGFGPTRPITQGGGGPMEPPVIVLPQGVDAMGRIYYRAMPAMGPGGPADSAAVFRVGAPGAAPERVVTVKTQAMTSTTRGGADERNVSIQPIPLSPTDVWAVAPDGSVAVARAGARRVEWIGPDGTVRRGPAMEFPAVAIGRAEREEWAADRESDGGGIGVRMEVENGRRSMTMSRGGGGGDLDLDAFTWPDAKGPWVDGSGRVDASGRFWVRRSLPAGEPALYDVFDEGGTPTLSVRMPPGRRIVGFGPRGLYAVHVDAFDLKTLERYAVPAG